MNAWPVDMLQKRDVYTCDHFGLKEAGPSIDDNVGNAIYAKSGNGIVYGGAVRDINGLDELLLRDLFGHQRVQEGKYTAGQIDTRWTDPIEQDYPRWLKQNEDRLPFPKSRIEEILREYK